MWRGDARCFSACAASVCVLLGCATLAAPAAASSGHLRKVEEEITRTIKLEQTAQGDIGGIDTLDAENDLKSSQAILSRTIREVQAAYDAGEIDDREAAEVILDLREAIAEDLKAEDIPGRLTNRERRKLVALAIAHKRRASKTAQHAYGLIPRGTTSLTPPSTPPPVVEGSDLSGQAEPDLGDINADLEMLNRIEKELREQSSATRALFDPFLVPARSSAAGATSNVTVGGTITSYTVKGYTISSNRPGAEGSGEIRLGIEEPQPNGQLKVISTSNPPNLLPRTSGVYTFGIGPPATGFAMPVTKGEVVSLDTPGGDYAVTTSKPGAQLESSQGTGLEQNPGTLWTLTQHPNLELLMRVTIQPSISVTKLEEAEKALKEALVLEHAAPHGSEKHVAPALKKAAVPLRKADELVATAAREGALSTTSQASIDFFLGLAIADVRDVRVSKNGLTAKGYAYAAAVDSQEALTLIGTAKGLAKKVS